MKMAQSFVCVLSLLMFAGGCVLTTATSFSDPEYGWRFYRRIMVIARLSPAHQKVAEDAAVKLCEDVGRVCVRGSDYLPPTGEFTGETLFEAFVKSKVDAYLILLATKKGAIVSHVPPTYHPGPTTRTERVVGDRVYVETRTEPGYISEGYTSSAPYADYVAELNDMNGPLPVWSAKIQSRGSARASQRDLTRDVARKAIRKLIEDGKI